MTEINFTEKDNSGLSLGVIILIVLFPLAGVFVYFHHKRESPKKATDACYAAIGGMVLGAILQALIAGTAG
jgi:hypothetical protein